MKVTFLGFTNHVAIICDFTPGGTGSRTVTQTLAMLLLTNSGSVSLQLERFSLQPEPTNQGNVFPTLGLGTPFYIHSLPQILKPGEFGIGGFHMRRETPVYRAELGFAQRNLGNRLSALCDRMGWDFAAEMLHTDRASNDFYWVTTGWITNPPAAPRRVATPERLPPVQASRRDALHSRPSSVG